MVDDLPSPDEILTTHDVVEEKWTLKYRGARVAAPKLKLERLLTDIREDYEPVYPRAAALLRKIATEHYFEDGNKRTAWLTMRAYLDQHGEVPAERGDEAVRVMKRIRRFTIKELALWLDTGDIDSTKLDP